MRTAAPPQELRDLPLEEIEPNLSQPRQYFDEAALDALAGSIGERGVLQPVLVRSLEDGKYELIVGERRWRAAKIAGLKTISALVTAYDDAPALEMGLIENMAREDLNPVEEARACEILVRERGLTYRQIGARVGRNKAFVANTMRLLQLSDAVLELLEYGELSEQGWTVEKLKARARESNMGGLDGKRKREKGHERDSEQARDMTVVNVARVWGDALGTEVLVRTLPGRKLRVELVFDSPEGALALGGRIAEKIARGTKRR